MISVLIILSIVCIFYILQDGQWDAPMIINPACEIKGSGCGTWTPPSIKNPKYKGIWKPPMIANPLYKGVMMFYLITYIMS